MSELNEDAEVVNELNDITYNKGSLMLNQLLSRRKPKVSAETLVNFRTDDVGDQGRDYFQITDREDYIIKMSLVMSDRILFPNVGRNPPSTFSHVIRSCGNLNPFNT